MVDYKEDIQVNFQGSRTVWYYIVVDTLFYAFVKAHKTVSHRINLNVCNDFLGTEDRGCNATMTRESTCITNVLPYLIEGMGEKEAGLSNFGKLCFDWKMDS